MTPDVNRQHCLAIGYRRIGMPLFDGVRYKARMIKAFLAAALCGLGGGVALAQGAMPGTVKPFASVRFAPDPDVACLASALETGNPATGASTWILKAPAGCVVPWHSHTAQEQLIVVAGEVVAEMTDHPPTLLGPGGFAMMAVRMAHQFTCQGRDGCVMFVTFDRAYDIKWEKAAR
jgi:quercetin dioxygenase-like cupin family protein